LPERVSFLSKLKSIKPLLLAVRQARDSEPQAKVHKLDLSADFNSVRQNISDYAATEGEVDKTVKQSNDAQRSFTLFNVGRASGSSCTTSLDTMAAI
jgi:hypothetical protein